MNAKYYTTRRCDSGNGVIFAQSVILSAFLEDFGEFYGYTDPSGSNVSSENVRRFIPYMCKITLNTYSAAFIAAK